MVLTVGEASSEPVMGLAASAAIQCDITVSSLVGQQCTVGFYNCAVSGVHTVTFSLTVLDSDVSTSQMTNKDIQM